MDDGSAEAPTPATDAPDRLGAEGGTGRQPDHPSAGTGHAIGRFSHRWGIALPDGGEGDTRIPNFFFDHYAEAGLCRDEFLAVLHLARYKFETAGSESFPAVATVARQMGYTPRGLQKVLAGLEDRGLLTRRFRPGKTTVYDFSAVGRAIIRVVEGQVQQTVDPDLNGGSHDRHAPQFIPTPEPQFAPGVDARTPEEQKKEQEGTRNDCVAPSNTDEDPQTSRKLLIAVGMYPDAAERWARQLDPAYIRGWVEHVQDNRRIKNRAAVLVTKFRENAPVPTPPSIGDEAEHDRYRYIKGEYGHLIQH